MTPNNNSEPSVQSVDRAIQILRCFEDGKKLGLTEISKIIGLHKSTTYGIVTTLKNNGFLEKIEDTGKYRLGMELFRIVSTIQADLRDICRPHIRRLSEATGETINLVIPDGIYVIYIEKQESDRSVKISTSIGKRLPMYCTGVGKAILAFLTQNEASSILDKTMLIPYTKNTLTSKEDIMQQIAQTREKGYALDLEELEYGLVCIAVPIVDHKHQPVAALSCSGPKQRMGNERLEIISAELLQHANEISRMLIN